MFLNSEEMRKMVQKLWIKMFGSDAHGSVWYLLTDMCMYVSVTKSMTTYQRVGASLQAALAQAHHAALSGLDGEAPPLGGVGSSRPGKSTQLQVAVGCQRADPWVWRKMNRESS